MEPQRNTPALNHPVNQRINFSGNRKTVIFEMMDRPWFTDKNFRLAARIEQIPPNGDMMISLSGAAEHIELAFHYNGTRFEDLAPAPFVIKANGLTILTFHSKDNKRIYPDFFQVV